MKDSANVETGIMTIILDGYNAPVTAGNFVDLVQRGFYDGDGHSAFRWIRHTVW